MTAQSFSHYPAIPAPRGVRLVTVPEHDCAYLPDRAAMTRALFADSLPPQLYHEMMDAGFRRSGRIVYQPVCRTCRACVSIRVPVATFSPSKSQRRCLRRNLDLVVTIARPHADDESFDLYHRYQTEWHRGESVHSREDFESFLYDSPVQTIEFKYRDAFGRLLAVGICDVCQRTSLSSVYFYFEPSQRRRGLGTFGALVEVEWARQQGIPQYYLGFWVAGCRAMEYKSQFRPHELLCGDGVWRTPDEVGRGM
jgi:arginine-tRNA-protein transferase